MLRKKKTNAKQTMNKIRIKQIWVVTGYVDAAKRAAQQYWWRWWNAGFVKGGESVAIVGTSPLTALWLWKKKTVAERGLGCASEVGL